MISARRPSQRSDRASSAATFASPVVISAARAPPVSVTTRPACATTGPTMLSMLAVTPRSRRASWDSRVDSTVLIYVVAVWAAMVTACRRRIPDHAAGLRPGQLIMISFKWNVHNAHRSMQSKWLQEIVHSNPAWLNPATARALGIEDGDWIEVVGHRPRTDTVPNGDGGDVGRLRIRAHLTEGVHPSVIAISHNAGRSTGGPVASTRPDPAGFAGYGPARDPDVEQNAWWRGEISVAQNGILPSYPDPRSGQQAYHDTVVSVRRLRGA